MLIKYYGLVIEAAVHKETAPCPAGSGHRVVERDIEDIYDVMVDEDDLVFELVDSHGAPGIKAQHDGSDGFGYLCQIVDKPRLMEWLMERKEGLL